MIKKLHNSLSKSIAVLFALAVIAMPGAGFAHTGDADIDTETSAETEITTSDSESAVDPDDDDDGIPEEVQELEEARDIEVNRGANREIDQTKEIDKTTPLLYQGISAGGQLCAQSEDCDDGDGDVSPEASQQLSIRVSGNEVRGWSEERKAQVRERIQAAGEATTANDFGIKVASAALDNESISEISSDDERTEVRYEATMKLFGFIPVNSQAVASAEAGGEASVDYPWYGFLASKPDHGAMVSLVADIRTSHDVMISVEEEGAPRNLREEDEDDSQ